MLGRPVIAVEKLTSTLSGTSQEAYILPVCRPTSYFPFVLNPNVFHYFRGDLLDIKETDKEQREHFKILHEDPE